MSDLVGQQLGNYHLLRLLGRGGFAEVYLGKHIHLDSQGAIKVLHELVTRSEEIDKFRNEARILASLDHPHIVRILDFDVKNSIPFIVMSFAPNGTLRLRHPQGTRLSPTTILLYVKQIASALQYGHDRKIVHRDVKPENILIGQNNELLLSDFGIAILAPARGMSEANPFPAAGTVVYMAPEQIQGMACIGSDQYALGTIIYEWLCGAPPFSGISSMNIALQHLNSPVPPLRAKVPGIPAAVEETIIRALAKDPHQRFASVQEFTNALEQAWQS